MRKRFPPEYNYLTLLQSCCVPLGLKHYLTDTVCSHEPSKHSLHPALITLHLFSQCAFIIMAQHAPAISTAPHTYAQCTALNSQPPDPSDSSFTTTSDTSSKFTTFKWTMPTNKKDLAIVEQENNKCPILYPGELNAEVFHQFKTACYNYITNKGQQSINQDHDHLKRLPMGSLGLSKLWGAQGPISKQFPCSFQNWLHALHLGVWCPNWAKQKDNQSFHDFANNMLNKNSLLLGMDSHLEETQVCTRIEAGMDHTLSTCSHISNENIHKIVPFKEWLDALKELDTQLQADCAECCAKLESITQRIWSKTHDDHSLSEPSCILNTTATSSYPSHTSSKDYPPKFTHEEGQLLVNNKGCTKCHKPFIFHMKDNNFPKDNVISQKAPDINLSLRHLWMLLIVLMRTRKANSL